MTDMSDEYKATHIAQYGTLTRVQSPATTTDQYAANVPSQQASSIPIAFHGDHPAPTPSGLTAYQLALADQMVKGTIPAFGVNPGFISAMNTFASTKLLTPATTDPKTGQTVQPPFAPGMAGTAYIIVGQLIHLVRQAQNCGPEEYERYEKIPIENLANTAIRTWQYYGDRQPSGSAADGSNIYGGV